ncbi:MaoC family dehydratase [Companilactobacillus mishanensis]|uniref:MaoC family dehydratase n=1 Tax=Companilactobacillus mishanensis TaxID=2486008 RepID=A0A5P0ZIL1_9LACO|nr:MaoC family dehydratase [Companilactobacillus mishanensis]MQS45573.1 MaoC family dehydratase [Companilactobacillus mishanensis]MQS52868.1 MaoC family dehydratase [Companilactobacillus mishanensis]MQS89879.1 MaoC family dehydratase [Companilactobacillus mishanensis]
MAVEYANVKESEIKVGMTDSISKKVTEADVNGFAETTGDHNPAHTDEEYASHTQFKTRIAHGMLGASLISAVLGMKLPGPGTIYLGQDLKFTHPIHFNDVITAKVTVKEIIPKKKFNLVILDTTVTNQAGDVAIEGTATVIPPKD